MSLPAVPRSIRLLSPLLANQIAAGEVVERPASVLKELLENSLDAGARRIEIDADEGGAALIRVHDDGCGIRRQDLPLALARHATSKVYDHDELMRVSSLGFRGEALASIASVSRLTLTTRAMDEAHGWRLAAGAEPIPDAHPAGTTVEVRDLFYNTPARRKFLRAERTEFDHLAEIARRIALSRFDVALSLRHNGRQVLQLRAVQDAQQGTQRVVAVCGRAFAERAWALDFAVAGMRLWGWLARPEAARAQADLQYFYLNGRVIRDRVVTHAVRQSYGDRLYPGRHPAYILFLEMEPTQVDVNVHPTKHEVRFREARRVHDFLFRALHEAIADAPLPAAAIAEPGADYRSTSMPAAAPLTGGAAGRRVLGLLHGRFLLVEEASGMRLVDVAAVRTLRAASAMREALAHAGRVRAQPLLLPVTVPVTSDAAERLVAAQAAMTELGFDVERLGPEQLVVREVPAVLRHVGAPLLLGALLPQLSAEVSVTTLLDALVPLAAAGAVPERAEWDGIVAAAGAAADGASALLSLGGLGRLLRRQ